MLPLYKDKTFKFDIACVVTTYTFSIQFAF